MRTTLDLDDALMREVSARAARSRKTLKAVVNQALALGLQGPRGQSSAPVWPVFDLGHPIIDLDQAWVAADALEASAYKDKAERQV